MHDFDLSSVKAKLWWFILYPESAPVDWKLQLQLTALPCVISPLHEPDSQEGTLKPHYHIIIRFPSATTFNNVKRITVKQLNATIPKPIYSFKTPYEYLTHKGFPDKQQFSDDIKPESVNDFPVISLLLSDTVNKVELHSSIMEDIEEYKFSEYFSLCRFYQYSDWEKYNYVISKTMFFKGYLQSRKFVPESELKKVNALIGLDDSPLQEQSDA